MADWEQTLLEGSSASLERNMQLASSALAHMSRFEQDASQDSPFPHIGCNHRGEIIWSNPAAVQLFEAEEGAGADVLGLSMDEFNRAWSLGMGETQVLRSVDPRNPSESIWYNCTRTELGLEFDSSEIYWSNHFCTYVMSAFGLTRAELDVLQHLARGLAAMDISQLRGSSIATVRTQIRAIYAKLEARSQPDLVRIIMGVVARYAEPPPPQNKVHQVTLTDGRTLTYRIHGPPRGRSVLYIHDEYYGIEVPEAFRQAAHQAGLCVIAPIKPYFGHSDGYPPGVEPTVQAAEDMLYLLDSLGVREFCIFARRTGLRHGLNIVHRAPDRVLGFVTQSPALPAKNEQEYKNATRFARVIMTTILKHPSMVECLVRAGLRYKNRVGAKAFAEFLNKGSEIDLALLEKPEVMTQINAGFELGATNGHLAYLHEVLYPPELTLNRLLDCPVRVQCLIGEFDPHDRIGRANRLINHGAPLEIQVVPGAGQLFFYSHPTSITTALEAAFTA